MFFFGKRRKLTVAPAAPADADAAARPGH